MDSRPALSLTRRGWMALALSGLAGCHGLYRETKIDEAPLTAEQERLTSEIAPLAPTEGGRLVTTWNPQVVDLPNTANGGSPVPGLLGRVFVFGPDMARPRPVAGSLVVDLYDHTNREAPAMLEEWRFTADDLKRLAKTDLFGEGYTVPLPWSTYRPTITQVHLVLRFQPGATGKESPAALEAAGKKGKLPPALTHSSTTVLDHTDWLAARKKP